MLDRAALPSRRESAINALMAAGLPDLPATEAELARRVSQGGALAAPAEAELCRRFAARIRAFGRVHLRDAAAAEDLTQRVLLITLEKLRAGAVREPDRIASFVLGTARLTAQSMRRDAGRGQQLPSEHAAPTPNAEPAAVLDRDRVLLCLDRLADRERSVIVLTFFDEASAGEIASSLGLEQGNVRVIRHRALAKLKDCLEPAAGGDA